MKQLLFLLVASCVIFAQIGCRDDSAEQKSKSKRSADAADSDDADSKQLSDGESIETDYLQFVPQNATVGIVFRPEGLLSSPDFDSSEFEAVVDEFQATTGVDLRRVNQVVMVRSTESLISNRPDNPNRRFRQPFQTGMIIRFAEAHEGEAIVGKLLHAWKEFELSGETCYRCWSPRRIEEFGDLCVHLPDDSTVILAQRDDLEQMLEARSLPNERLTSVLRDLDEHAELSMAIDGVAVRDLARTFGGEWAAKIPQVASWIALTEQLQQITLRAELSPRPMVSMTVTSVSSEAAKTLRGELDMLLAVVRNLVNSPQFDDAATSREEQLAHLAISRLLTSTRTIKRGKSVTIESRDFVTGSELAGMLIPTIRRSQIVARQQPSQEKLAQLATALRSNVVPQTGRFLPSASYDADSRPLLSWRVHLLPYLREQELYDEFHLDEPWDSPHNRTLIHKMPDVYRTPGSRVFRNGRTCYLAVCGDQTAFGETGGTPPLSFRDGLQQTILLVEVAPEDAVIWTKPVDWNFDADNPRPQVGTPDRPGFNVVFADGRPEFLFTTMPDHDLRALFTRNGAEEISR